MGLRFAARFTAAETPVGYYHCVHKVKKKKHLKVF